MEEVTMRMDEAMITRDFPLQNAHRFRPLKNLSLARDNKLTTQPPQKSAAERCDAPPIYGTWSALSADPYRHNHRQGNTTP